jgi:hypothetical protein
MLACRTVLGALIPLLAAFAMLCSTGSAASLAGKTVCLDPGHGGTTTTNSYRVGLGGECGKGLVRENVIFFACTGQ